MKDVAESVLARLLDIARANRLVYNELLMRYILERIFYRIGKSGHSGKFILKGGTLFVCWQGGFDHRPTMDADMLYRGVGTPEHLKAVFTEICTVPTPDDGLRIDVASMTAERILEDAEYGGVRLSFNAHIGRSRTQVQIDVGVGDAVTPTAKMAAYPTLLDFPAPRMRIYPPETAIAEKFETLVRRGMLNSRMKDFYDIWKLKTLFDYDINVLGKAIARTFERRKRPIPTERPIALTERFWNDPVKQQQWHAFLRKSRLDVGNRTLHDIIHEISDFLTPVINRLNA